jgi:hypothetical protein
MSRNTPRGFLSIPWLVMVACHDEPLPDAPAGTLSTSAGPGSFPEVPDDSTGTTAELPTTTASPGTTDTSTSTSGVPDTGDAPGPFCGDGELDPGEACDDGDANSDNHHCTVACRLNVCGDGHLFLGWELCDEGAANGDEYGRTCTLACEPGVWCGDNVTQPEFAEECDLGVHNGTGVEDEHGVACDMCRLAARRAFITSATFTGDLGGVWQADARCKELAAAAGDPRAPDYYALLSTSTASAAERLTALDGDSLPYVGFTGEKLADSLADLLAAGPAAGITFTENGDALLDARVLTGTAPGGGTFADQHCQDWTSADKDHGARVGQSFPSDPGDIPGWQAEGWWTSFASYTCEKPFFRLYCIEL